MVRPKGIEPLSKASKALVLSIKLRARATEAYKLESF